MSDLLIYLAIAVFFAIVLFSEYRFYTQKKRDMRSGHVDVATGQALDTGCAIADCVAAVIAGVGAGDKLRNAELIALYYKLLIYGRTDLAQDYRTSLTEIIVLNKIREDNSTHKQVVALLERTMAETDSYQLIKNTLAGRTAADIFPFIYDNAMEYNAHHAINTENGSAAQQPAAPTAPAASRPAARNVTSVNFATAPRSLVATSEMSTVREQMHTADSNTAFTNLEDSGVDEFDAIIALFDSGDKYKRHA